VIKRKIYTDVLSEHTIQLRHTMRVGIMAQEVAHLASKHKALNLSPSTANKNKNLRQ
jgi:hypothetical protein